ncbi:MAG: ATP-binding protein [Propylenella sp.]
MAPFHRAGSIRAKLAILIAASVGASVLLAFGIGSYRELARFGEAKRSELQATAQILAASVAGAVASGDRVVARQALNAIGRIRDVRFAEIRNLDGTTFAEAGVGVALTSVAGLPENNGASVWRMLTEGSFLVTSDIVRGGRKVGSLVLLVGASELAERLEEALLAALLSAGTAILIGVLVASRLQRAITEPLGELTQTMNEVRKTSDFTRRASRKSEDETGQLVDAFNDMLDQIGRRDRALEDHREGLERTVSARTRDLVVARDAAETANRAKSDFLATMSHEIRTPMNGMLVMAELLAGSELAARPQRYAETIVRSGQTLLAIINDILDLSKIEAGRLELEQGRVSVETIADDVLSLFSERAASKGLDLAAEIDAHVPAAIEGDPVRLSQIIANLVNNALKFTESGHVKLSVERPDDGNGDRAELIFTVEDTGIGIPADKVERIFEAFSQADQSTTRRFGGTGLGLSICQRLVGAMGGRIWAESELGIGSRFIFTLGARVLEAAPAGPPAAGRSAMLAVDGVATRSALARVLKEFGFAVFPEVAVAASEPKVIFAAPDWIEARPHRTRHPDDASVICVAGVGESKVERLIAAGFCDAVLSQPVSSGRVREILRAAESGTLATLLEARRTATGPELPDLSGLAVLVADDSPVNREVVSEALARLKARTTTVENGRQAVEAFKRGGFDVVLMDCSMPELDGFAATREIRAYEAEGGLARTPIVALTAHVAGSPADSWRDAGMDDYLTKPFTIRGLSDCIARLAAPAERAAVGDGAQQEPAPPPETAEMEAPPAAPLDPEVLASLNAIAGGDSAMLGRIFGLFLAHAPARLAALRLALADGDLARAATEAHALKSPSLNIGALRLGALCADLEAQARASDQAILSGMPLAELEGEFAAVMAAIEREQASRELEGMPERQAQATID